MSVDLEALLGGFRATVGRNSMTDAEFGDAFRQITAALARFDYVVAFAYRGKQKPIDLYSTFDPQEHVVFVSLYQAGPYLLDPFYHTARERRTGVFRMRELAPDRFFSSEYYRSYYVQTGLAEEIGFFIPLDEDVTVVLSLMRREKTGPFPAGEFALLRKSEALIAALVRHVWPDLGPRFDAERNAGRRKGRRQDGIGASQQRADTVWRDLRLTVRETAIVDLVLQGHSSESIGLKLNISTGTVKVHRRNVYRKLGISSQTQLLSIYLGAIGRIWSDA